MEHITPVEREIIKNLHLKGRGILVTAHAPQQSGGCHPFDFLRGVFPKETLEDAFQRVKKDTLQHIAHACGSSCTCNNDKEVITYRPFPL